MTLAAILAFLAAHWAEVLVVFGALHVIAVTIVNATPTDTDNKVLAVLHRILVLVADVIPNTKTGSVPGEKPTD